MAYATGRSARPEPAAPALDLLVGALAGAAVMYLFDPDGSAGPEEPRWERMECRTEVYAIKGIPFEEQEICRTRHGPIPRLIT